MLVRVRAGWGTTLCIAREHVGEPGVGLLISRAHVFQAARAEAAKAKGKQWAGLIASPESPCDPIVLQAIHFSAALIARNLSRSPEAAAVMAAHEVRGKGHQEGRVYRPLCWPQAPLLASPSPHVFYLGSPGNHSQCGRFQPAHQQRPHCVPGQHCCLEKAAPLEKKLLPACLRFSPAAQLHVDCEMM